MSRESRPPLPPLTTGKKSPSLLRSRLPGLDLVRAGAQRETAGKLDERLVDEAIAHLREILADPYYFEALRWLKAHADPLVLGRPVRTGDPKGELAARLQKQPQRKVGRPRTAHSIRGLLKAFEARLFHQELGLRDAATLAQFARKLIALKKPQVPAHRREPEAKTLATAMREQRSRATRVRSRPAGEPVPVSEANPAADLLADSWPSSSVRHAASRQSRPRRKSTS